MDLLEKLQARGIMVLDSSKDTYLLEQGYQIEIEGISLFRLLQNGYIIAPFDDFDELCDFIDMDKHGYGKG